MLRTSAPLPRQFGAGDTLLFQVMRRKRTADIFPLRCTECGANDRFDHGLLSPLPLGEGATGAYSSPARRILLLMCMRSLPVARQRWNTVPRYLQALKAVLGALFSSRRWASVVKTSTSHL